MNNSSFTLMLMISGMWLACISPKEQIQDISNIDFDSFKKQLGLNSDSECLDRILQTRNTRDTIRIIFSNNEYHFDQTLGQRELEGNWILRGRGKTKFFLSSTLVNILAPKCQLEFNQNISRHSKQVKVVSTCEDISLLRMKSNKIVESAWNYTAGDLVRVQKSENGVLNFSDSMNFSYEPVIDQMFGYKHCSVALESIDFIFTSDQGALFSFTGISLSIKGCEFSYVGETQIHALVSIFDCEPVKVSGVKMVGKVNYGILINGSRNVWCTDICSEECIHPIVPATWTTNVKVEGLHCIGSVIDAHPSFFVSYKDVTIEKGTSYWNCRALGVKLENCYFDVLESVTDESLYIGVLALTEDYLKLYDEYDVNCTNVNWVHQDYLFNGLHVHKCRDFILDECKTHAVSCGDKIRRFRVTNSKIGRLYCSDSNFEVINTDFDAKLQRRDVIIPPLSCSYDGVMKIDQCSFNGYDSTYLFRYIQSDKSELRITETDILSFKGFAEKSYFPPEAYSRIEIDAKRISKQVLNAFHSFSGIKYNH